MLDRVCGHHSGVRLDRDRQQQQQHRAGPRHPRHSGHVCGVPSSWWGAGPVWRSSCWCGCSPAGCSRWTGRPGLHRYGHSPAAPPAPLQDLPRSATRTIEPTQVGWLVGQSVVLSFVIITARASIHVER